MGTISTELANVINNYVEYKGAEENFSLRTNYSGRGMYGRKCFGFVVSDLFDWLPDLLNDVKDLDSENGIWDEFMEVLANANTDNMAFDTIVYFPRYSWPDDLEINDEDENDENDDA